MLNSSLYQFLTRLGKQGKWLGFIVVVLLAAGIGRASSITVTIADNDSSQTKTLTSTTGKYSITAANFALFDFQGIIGTNIEGTIDTNDNAGNVVLSTLSVSIGATLTAAAPKTLTITITDANFMGIQGSAYSGISRVGGTTENVTPGMSVRNEADFSSPTTAVIVTATSAGGLTFANTSNMGQFIAGEPIGKLTVSDTLSGTFLATGDDVNTLNGSAQAQLTVPEPSSIINGLTGVLGLFLGASIRRRKQVRTGARVVGRLKP